MYLSIVVSPSIMQYLRMFSVYFQLKKKEKKRKQQEREALGDEVSEIVSKTALSRWTVSGYY